MKRSLELSFVEMVDLRTALVCHISELKRIDATGTLFEPQISTYSALIDKLDKAIHMDLTLVLI